ncbi:hypothetical protein BPMI_01900c [Candidatus Burkholderia pumila]|uniref:Uncharacterized protein n=1 Tax=Candidatus Burkholderia pumila TaxID=1090375 RepID=A0ABR5HPL2_9BURK|nr:hypothetical protein BPMI_01900c [Candidatus Burkholderia pumila]
MHEALNCRRFNPTRLAGRTRQQQIEPCRSRDDQGRDAHDGLHRCDQRMSFRTPQHVEHIVGVVGTNCSQRGHLFSKTKKHGVIASRTFLLARLITKCVGVVIGMTLASAAWSTDISPSIASNMPARATPLMGVPVTTGLSRVRPLVALAARQRPELGSRVDRSGDIPARINQDDVISTARKTLSGNEEIVSPQ